MTPTEAPTWIGKVASLLFVVFCMELGLFLAIYPWSDRWTVNLIPALLPSWQSFWLSGYFRGLVSGVGLVNLWIALAEIHRIKRLFVRPTS